MSVKYHTIEEHLQGDKNFAKLVRIYEELRVLNAELPIKDDESRTPWLSRYDEVTTRYANLQSSLDSAIIEIFEREILKPGRNELNLSTLFGQARDLQILQIQKHSES